MRVDLLGAVEVWLDSGPVRVPKGRVQVLLITLALAGGRPVGANALIDRVWGEQLPGNPVGSLVTLIHRLREAIGRDAVVSASGGYSLRVEPEQVDVLRFRRLIADAAGLEDDAKSQAMLDEAIGLWRGEPLAGIAAFERDEIPHIKEEYLGARERRIALDVATGRHETAIVELYELTAGYPLRETLWLQLISALARAGRQAEALNVYETVRRRLADELGVDPSAGLRELHGQILRGEPLVDQSPVVAADVVDEPGPPRSLPGDIADFAGRGRELAAVGSAAGKAADTVVVVAIDGMGGAGKTMLAVRAAHQLAPRFPDGQLFLDLRGHSPGEQPMPPEDALGNLLRTTGAAAGALPESLDELAGLWRSRIAGRRVLVVLDNAADVEQIRRLLPGTAGSLVLITSRRRLVDLDTTATVSIGELDNEPARALFAAVVGQERAAAEPQALSEVLALCGHLPLAIRIAAARLRSRPAWHVAHLAGRLRNAHGRLAELSAGDRDVAATLAVSYHHLASSGRRMFRLLGLVPGSTIDTYAAAALAGITATEAEPVLTDLVDAHLLAEIAPGRFQLHDLLREQARRLASTEEPAAQRQEAELRLLDHYLALAGRSQATLLGVPINERIEQLLPHAELPPAVGYQALREILQSERMNLLALVDWAAETGRDNHAIWLPYVLGYFLDLSGFSAEAERTHRIAIAAAERSGEDVIRAGLVGNLSAIQFSVGRFTAALETANRAEHLFRGLDDTGGQGRALNNAGNALYRMGRYPEALDRYQRALAQFSDDQDPTATALLINLAIIEVRVGQPDVARDHAERALIATEQPGNRQRADALGAIGGVDRYVGNYPAAERAYAEAARISLEMGDVAEQVAIANDHAILDRLRGRYAAAVARHVQALRLIRATDNVGADETSNDLGITLLAAGHPLLAASAHRAALEPATASANRYELARAHAGIAAATATTDPSGALRQAERALREIRELGLPTPQRLTELIAELSAADHQL